MQKSLLAKMLLVASSVFVIGTVSTSVYALDILASETDTETDTDITTETDTDTSFDLTTDLTLDDDDSETDTQVESDTTLSLDTDDTDDTEDATSDTSTLPDTGRISAAPVMALIAVFVAASVYALKKSNEYKNI